PPPTAPPLPYTTLFRSRTDDGTDVAPIHYDASRSRRRLGREAPLEVEQRRPHRRNGCHLRSRFANRFVAQPGAGQIVCVDRSGRRSGGSGVRRILSSVENPARHGTIEQARVEIAELQVRRETARERSLARSRGTVHRDDHWPLGAHRQASASAIAPPTPFISATKPGKLVAMGAASSTVTASPVAMPSTRKDMAIRWSSSVAMVAPPRTVP